MIVFLTDQRMFMRCSLAVVSRLLVLVICGVSAGCGERIRVSTVSGTVTLDGKPIPGLMVEFAPAENPGWRLPLGIGYTDAEGRYSLVRPGPGGKTGTSVGKHVVRVTTSDGGEIATPNGKKVSGAVLEWEVEPGNNTVDIHLTSP